ncbi:integral membrane protein [Colletotrichum acutatum]
MVAGSPPIEVTVKHGTTDSFRWKNSANMVRIQFGGFPHVIGKDSRIFAQVLTLQLLYYGVATCFILGVILGGAGHDVGVLDPNLHVSHFVKIFLAAQVMYASELLAIKLGIITLMQRIFSQSSSWFRATSWVAVGLSCIWALYTALLGFVICQPIQSAWDITVTKTGCGNYTVAFSAVAIFDIIADIVIVVLPIKVVSGLQMARAHKVALYVVFGAGFM